MLWCAILFLRRLFLLCLVWTDSVRVLAISSASKSTWFFVQSQIFVSFIIAFNAEHFYLTRFDIVCRSLTRNPKILWRENRMRADNNMYKQHPEFQTKSKEKWTRACVCGWDRFVSDKNHAVLKILNQMKSDFLAEHSLSWQRHSSPDSIYVSAKVKRESVDKMRWSLGDRNLKRYENIFVCFVFKKKNRRE